MTSRAIRNYGVPIALLVGATALFFLVAYNSGYGYDALEYLVIGRSLLDGYSLYDFIPSKSWGLYTLVSAFLLPGNTGNHCGVSALIALTFSAALASVFSIMRRRYDGPTAYISATLVGLSALFMEMNYLEPEIFTFLCGLAAFTCLSPSTGETAWKSYLAAGICIGIGFAFKSVAGFYFVAALVFALLWGRAGERFTYSRITANALGLTLGFAVALLAPLLYFTLTGRLAEHVEWTYVFPLVNRPAGITWMYKLSTKLLWFLVLLTAAIIVSLPRNRRRATYAKGSTVLALLMGAVSLLALLKQQASHYVFPAAGFLSMYMAVVFCSLRPKAGKIAPPVLVAILLFAITIPASVALYNPRAIHRITQLADYSQEEELAAYIQDHLEENDLALFFKKGTLQYWISHRYPAIPFVKFHVQETHALKQQPDILYECVDNPRLKLVEFNPNWPGIQDESFMKQPGSVALLSEFHGRLVEEFVLADDDTAPYIFWRRRNTAAD